MCFTIRPIQYYADRLHTYSKKLVMKTNLVSKAQFDLSNRIYEPFGKFDKPPSYS